MNGDRAICCQFQMLDHHANHLRIAFWKVERTALQQGRWYGLLVLNPAFDHRRFFECGLRSEKRFLMTFSASDDCASRLFCCGPIIGISERVEDRFDGESDAVRCCTAIDP